MLSVQVRRRAALFQQDIEAVEEVVKSAPHHPQNVSIFLIAHAEELFTKSNFHSFHLDFCRVHTTKKTEAHKKR